MERRNIGKPAVSLIRSTNQDSLGTLPGKSVERSYKDTDESLKKGRTMIKYYRNLIIYIGVFRLAVPWFAYEL